MPTNQTINQGSYNKNEAKESSKWICPNDETINSGDYCIICGCARPNENPILPQPPEPDQPPVTTPPEIPPKRPKNYWPLIAVLCTIGIAGIAFLINSINSLYGYYISESGYYSVSIEKDGTCYWYQDSIRFAGTYEKNDSSLQLYVNGQGHYADTAFLAAIEKQGLRIAGGTVNFELFIKGSKSDEIRDLDQKYDNTDIDADNT